MPRLLDLFSCGGGAALGYKRAGFHVTGVDVDAKAGALYLGDEFIEADVLELDPDWVAGFDAVHASPPCQAFTPATAVHGTKDNHVNLVPQTRALIEQSGIAGIIENVPGAPIAPDVVLCGSMFGMQIRRHRLFELVGPAHPVLIPHPPMHDHRWEMGVPYSIYGSAVDGPKRHARWVEWSNRTEPTERPHRQLAPTNRDHAADLMGMPRGLPSYCYAEAIPPAYTEWLGRHILRPAIGA